MAGAEFSAETYCRIVNFAAIGTPDPGMSVPMRPPAGPAARKQKIHIAAA
jgi:hypothetical protein